jgi:hypothetical protein
LRRRRLKCSGGRESTSRGKTRLWHLKNRIEKTLVKKWIWNKIYRVIQILYIWCVY